MGKSSVKEVKKVEKPIPKADEVADKKFIICTLLIGGAVFGVLVLIMGAFMRGPMMPKVRVPYPKVSEGATYVDRIFDTNSMHEVNIIISNEDWEDLKANALDKIKYKVDVVIDGVEMKDVSFSTKGNSSLKNIAEGPGEGPAATRYSFKIDFDKYVEGQSYYGLDVLNLNNIYGDASYLNDFMAYELFREVGVPTPLDSFVYVKINGVSHGLYLAVEEISDSFYKRNNLTGNLYKPEQFEGKDNGATLTYTDDQIMSYVNIFDNAETTIYEADKIRLIQALKKLNTRGQEREALNVEEVLRYFAAHNFLLSYDSYTGKSIHNYFLNEKDGILTIYPWDYNLAYGRFNMGEDTTYIVNYGIDSPLCLAEEQNRPLWNWVANDSEALGEYHDIMNQLLVQYLEKGKFNEKVDEIYGVIKPYIQQDVSSFYSPQQVDTAVRLLKEFVEYRTQSVRLQLDGKLSTYTTEQDDTLKIDASGINLNEMGLVADDSKRNQQQGLVLPGNPQGNAPAPSENPNASNSSRNSSRSRSQE